MIIKKVSDLEGAEAGNFDDWCFNFDHAYIERKQGSLRSEKDAFGLCSSCARFQFARSEFSIEFCVCSRFEKPLNARKAIVDCSEFVQKGTLSIYEMKEMAYLIDLEEKDRAGF